MSRFEIKIVAALLLIAIIPLATSVILVDQVIRVSDSVAEGQTRRLAEPLSHAARAYRALFAARKRGFELQARIIAHDAALIAAVGEGDLSAARTRLARLLREAPGLGAARLTVEGRRIIVRRGDPFAADAHRKLRLREPVGDPARQLEMTFFTDRRPFDDYQALGAAQQTALEITSLRTELGSYYRVVFLAIFGAVLLVATGVGLFIARRTARRVTVLVRATREVGAGNLETRVQVRGRDELSELAASFNEMVGELEENRERIGYLEKIGAWQDIARRLAHEIKNPLTPIQLAVQQVHEKYAGKDQEFRRLLDDARDIISEEVEALRRLVQAFSSFARLPSVKPEPVDLNALVDDFFKSHVELTERLKSISWEALDPPGEVLVDRMLIKHVLFNLVENAVQAAEDAKRLEELAVAITVRRDEVRQQVALTVADDGPGIAPDVASRIFDPYFTTKERGTGLGLAIVKKIVLEHRGTVSVTSRLGEGSRFTITLPLVAQARQESAIRTTISRLLGAGGSSTRS